MPASLSVGGTGIIIITGVIIEIIRQMDTKIQKTKYRGFI